MKVGNILFECLNVYLDWWDQLDAALAGVPGGDLIQAMVMISITLIIFMGIAVVLDEFERLLKLAAKSSSIRSFVICSIVALTCMATKNNPVFRMFLIRHIRRRRPRRNSLTGYVLRALIRQERELGVA